MLYANFLAELDKASLTVRAFAALIGMNPNSISNYARRGEIPTHLAIIAVLIGELSLQRIDYKSIIRTLELVPKKPRGGGRQGHFGGDRQSNLDLKL